MKKDDVIVLENNEKYSLLSEIEYEGNKYFIASKFIDNDKLDTSKFKIIKLVEENDEKFIEIVVDKKLVEELSLLFEKDIKK